MFVCLEFEWKTKTKFKMSKAQAGGLVIATLVGCRISVLACNLLITLLRCLLRSMKVRWIGCDAMQYDSIRFAIEKCEAKGIAVTVDGAVWFVSTRFDKKRRLCCGEEDQRDFAAVVITGYLTSRYLSVRDFHDVVEAGTVRTYNSP